MCVTKDQPRTPVYHVAQKESLLILTVLLNADVWQQLLLQKLTSELNTLST